MIRGQELGYHLGKLLRLGTGWGATRSLTSLVQKHLFGKELHLNAGIVRMRALEQRVGSPGRYEWEFRLQREPQAQDSVAWLDRFAALARRNGVDPETVYVALGGSPALEPWSPAARAWCRETPPSAPARLLPES